MTETAPLNPYAPTAEVADAVEIAALAASEPASLRRTAIRWFFVCSISAVPSFVLGLTVTDGEQIAAMVIGILIFAVGYTALDYRTSHRPWRQNPMIRRTLRLAYGTRVAISLLFPLGGFLDLYCGIVAIWTTELVSGQGLTVGSAGSGPVAFLRVVFTTLVQGSLMNIVLGLYAVLILGVHIIIRAIRT